MLNALPVDKGEILLIAHNSDYDCRFISEYSQNVKAIVESVRFYISKQPIITLKLARILIL